MTRSAVSINVAKRYLELDGRSWHAEISHQCKATPGCGYGTSGAGALSLSIALNDALGLSFSMSEAGQIAHVCEVECKTGLGTVASVFSGGLAVRTVPGAPDIGKVRKLSVPSSLGIVSASFGPISTRKVLANLDLKNAINSCGQALVQRFLRDGSFSNFMALSRNFSDCVGLVSSRLRSVMKAMDSSGYNCSMMMLGESLFCFLPREAVPRVEALLRSYELQPLTSRVARSGACLI